MAGTLQIDLDQELTDQISINKNLSQDIIVTNADKIEILLIRHHKTLKRKRDWSIPLGILLTVLATLLTAKFDEYKFGLSPDFWFAIFIITCIMAACLSFYYILIALLNIKKGTVESFITSLKNESQSSSETVGYKIKPGIFIVSAKYGVKGSYIDVTQKVVKTLINNDCTIIASNDLVDGKDPAVGQRKKLIIEYKKYGKDRVSDTLENLSVSF